MDPGAMQNDNLEFASKYTQDAREARENLPPDIQNELHSIIDNLTDDPGVKAHPHRMHSLSRNGTVRLYKHPSPPVEVTYEIDLMSATLYIAHVAAPSFSMMKELFISYSHKDAEWLNKLKEHLVPLENADKIKIWDDNEIKAGDLWFEEIEKSLEAAKAAVLLVTPSFLDSKFVHEHELPKLLSGAKDKGVRILWIAVSQCSTERTELSQYQAVNEPTQPLDTLAGTAQKEALQGIYNEITRAIE